MLTVLTYWCYLFIITSILGVGFQGVSKLKKVHPVITLFLGGFTTAIIASSWAIFSGLQGYFESTLLIFTITIAIWKRKEYGSFLLSLKAKINTLPSYLNILFGIIILFAVAQSASAPYIIDNESYYIQTIKWLDTYGYVKGLANFHFFLGQTSGWHILQSALNLDILSDRINDINGFYLVLGNFYAFDALSQYFKQKKKLLLIIGS